MAYTLSTHLWQDAAVAVRRAIVSGELKAGERVSEARLAETLGTSRQPVRDAIRVLVQEGMLVQQGNATIVARCSPDDIRDLYRFRLHLETYAIRLAAGRISREAEAAMRAASAAMRVAGAAGERHDRVLADLDFHRAICVASGDRWLVSSWERLAPTLEATMILAHKTPVVDEAEPNVSSRDDRPSRHARIMEALIEGDASLAESLLSDSLIGPVERLIARLYGDAEARELVIDGLGQSA